jgi:hypothetical protein
LKTVTSFTGIFASAVSGVAGSAAAVNDQIKIVYTSGGRRLGVMGEAPLVALDRAIPDLAVNTL